MKKQREYDDEMNDAAKAKEVTAYEDSWYRSLKALADMRPTETDLRPAEVKDALAGEVHPASEGSQPTTEDVHHTAEGVRPAQGDEETAGVPED